FADGPRKPAPRKRPPTARRTRLLLEELERRDAPSVTLVTPGNLTNYDGDQVTFVVRASDTTGAPVHYAVTSAPPGVSVDANNGTVSGPINSAADLGSPYTTTFVAYDGTSS